MTWDLLFNWRVWVLLALAGLSTSTWYYKTRYHHEQEAFALYEGNVKLATKAVEQQRAADAAASNKTIKEKDDARLQMVAATASAWNAYLGLVRKSASGTVSGPKPVPPVTRVCQGQDDNNRLSAALQSYRGSVTDELTQYRLEVGRLLEVCSGQANDLKLTMEWALDEQRIHQH